MIETIFGKNVLQVYFEVLAWPMSYLTLFKLDFFFWSILHSTTRGQLLWFDYIFGEALILSIFTYSRWDAKRSARLFPRTCWVLAWFNELKQVQRIRGHMRSVWVHKEKLKNPWQMLYIKARSSFSVFRCNPVVMSCFHLMNLSVMLLWFLCVKAPLLCLWSVEHQCIYMHIFWIIAPIPLNVSVGISCLSLSSYPAHHYPWIHTVTQCCGQV